MKDIVLLGAGASAEAGVPVATDMTKRMLELFETQYPRYNHAIRIAVGGRMFQRGVDGDNPFDGINIEDLFNTVQLLSERHTLEAAPFISSWHPAVDRVDRPPKRRADTDEVYREVEHIAERVTKATLKQLGGRQSFGQPFFGMSDTKYSFRRALEKMLPKDTDNSGKGRVFEETNELMIRLLVKMAWIDKSERVEYLRPLVSYCSPLVIATLNYDNAIELACSNSGIPVSTGIAEWSDKGTLSRPENGVWLLKLHGSINWALVDGARSNDKPMAYQEVKQLGEKEMLDAQIQPAVVFGGKNKLTVNGPYLDLLRTFQEQLKLSDRLTVVGYSFRDEHINSMLWQWINGNQCRTVRLIGGGSFKGSRLGMELRHLLGNRIDDTEQHAGEGIRSCFTPETN